MQLKTFLFIAVAILLTSCKNNPDGFKQEDMQKLGESIFPNIPADSKISDMNFTSTMPNYVSSEFSSVNVYFTTPSDEKKYADITFKEPDRNAIKDNSSSVESWGEKNKIGRILTNYDFTVIEKNYDKAIKELEKENILISGVNSYNIKFYEDPQFDKHQFELLSKHGSTKFTGRKISTEYIIIKCIADAEGNITYPDLEEDNE